MEMRRLEARNVDSVSLRGGELAISSATGIGSVKVTVRGDGPLRVTLHLVALEGLTVTAGGHKFEREDLEVAGTDGEPEQGFSFTLSLGEGEQAVEINFVDRYR